MGYRWSSSCITKGMKSTCTARMVAVMAAMLAIASLAHAQKSLSRDSLKGVEITVRGCVKPGINAGTVVLDHVVELAPDGRELPPVPRGLPTAVYLFNDARRLLSHAGQIVDVRGRIKDVRDSFIDLKPGPAHDDTSIADIH